RVANQAREGLSPEIIYTEMDLALRLVRDVFSDEFKRMLVDNRAVYEKVVSFLKKTSPQLVRRVSLHKDRTPLFDVYDLQPAVESALKRVVPLPSGGHISVDKTEALTAIDVNTGKFVGKKNLAETILRTNLEAADEVVRQLRLRDIGGIIVIDFIDMEDQFHRAEVMQRFANALERDRTKTRVNEISRLGLLEMTRKNVTDGLYGALTERCPCCNGEGRVLSSTTQRIVVERRMREILADGRSAAYLFGVSPSAYEQLMAPGHNVVATLRTATGKQVAIVSVEDCDPTEVRVLIEGKAGVLKDGNSYR
ncbi:MAG: ribonuclease E/G, partial [Coriobacteriia bacterium]|nr:ribonuclease E/G [Coriobacteriia bacterium]